MHGWWDHILTALIAIALPVYGTISWRSFRREVARLGWPARRRAYIETLIIEWSLSLAVLLLWSTADRSWPALGVTARWSFAFVLCLLLAFGAGAFHFRQWIRIRRLNGEIPDSVKDQIEAVAEMLPRTKLEMKWFIAVSLTAGICEELLFRGFLIWYFEFYVGLAISCAISVLIFGLGHAYQEKEGILKTSAMGLILTLIFLWCRSLFPPIILHAFTDIGGGAIGREVVNAIEKNRKMPDSNLSATAGSTN